MIKVLGCALVGSLLFAGAIQLAPAAPPKATLGTQSINSWVYDPATKEMRVARSGVIAQGYMPLAKKADKLCTSLPCQAIDFGVRNGRLVRLDDPEAAGDLADVQEAASKKMLAQK